MCSSGRLCGSSEPTASSGAVSKSGSQYALCALGVGLIALGIVMIVWTVVPQDGEALGSGGNSSQVIPSPDDDNEDDEASATTRTTSVAYVLVGSGTAMLLLSFCLGVRNKRRENRSGGAPGTTGAPFMDHVAGEQGETSGEPVPTYDVPSYLEAVGSGQYPVRQSNLRQSTSQLPSYEDLISAVENEGAEPSPAPIEEAPPTPAAAAPEPQPAP